MLWATGFGLAGDIWEAAWSIHLGLPMGGGTLYMTPEICCRGRRGRDQEFAGTCTLHPSERAVAREGLSKGKAAGAGSWKLSSGCRVRVSTEWLRLGTDGTCHF